MLRRLARACGLVVDQRPPDIDTDTLAGAHQVGRDGGSGMVDPLDAVDYTDAGGRQDLLGHDIQPVSGVEMQPRVPDSLLANRPLFGGVRTAPATREYVQEPGMTGGYNVITGRPNVQLGQISVVQEAGPAVSRAVPSSNVGSCNDRANASIGPVDLADLQRDTLADSLGWARQ